MKNFNNPIHKTVSKVFKINEKKTLKWSVKMSKLRENTTLFCAKPLNFILKLCRPH